MTTIEMKKKTEIWPLAIIGAFVFFAAFIITMVYFMMNEDIGLVSKNYYKEEIAFQQQIDKANLTEKEHFKVGMKMNNADGYFELSLPTANTAGVSGDVKFTRPSDSKLDFKVPFAPGVDGTQKIPVTSLKDGLWKVSLDWKQGEKAYYQEDLFNVGAVN